MRPSLWVLAAAAACVSVVPRPGESVTTAPTRSPSAEPTNYLNERPTPPTFPTLQPTPSPSIAPTRPTVSARPTYTTRSPTTTRVQAIACPVPTQRVLVSGGNNSRLMSLVSDGSALRMESATITVMYHDGQRVMQKQSFDFGMEFVRERVVHVGEQDSLRMLSAFNTQKSTVAIGYMQSHAGAATVTYDPYNGWLNSTVEYIIDTSTGLDSLKCAAGSKYFWCVAAGRQLVDMPDFGNMEFRVFRKIAAPRPGKVVNDTVVDKDPTEWSVLPNFVSSELIWGNYDAVDAVMPAVITYDGTQEIICVGALAQFNDTISNPLSWTLYDGCCKTKCYYNINFPFNGQELTRVMPMAYNPEDTIFLPNKKPDNSYYWGIAYNLYAPAFNYFPLTVNQQYKKWAGTTAAAGAPEYWIASNGRNGTALIVYFSATKLVSQVTKDLGDTPWSRPVSIYLNNTAYAADPLKVTGLRYDAFYGTFFLEMQNTKQVIQRTYDILRGYWLNDTTILVTDKSVAKNSQIVYASGSFGENYAITYVEPNTGNLYVETCIPTNSPTQSPVPEVSGGARVGAAPALVMAVLTTAAWWSWP